MIIECNNGVRPIRLSEKTRQFAYDSLHYKYGKDTDKNYEININISPQEFSALGKDELYCMMIERIVKEAPIRICDGERLSGAATLGKAITHWIPANINGYERMSVSHLTVDFETVVRDGMNSVVRRADTAYAKYKGTDREIFAASCVKCLEYMRIWRGRYLDALRGMPEYRENYENLLKVPFEPAETFYEAVQSIWFSFAFLRLCGNWPGIGRIDKILGPYLKKDLAEGRITLDEAREILAHFFIKGCEWIKGGDYISGDAQHYQNIVLSGVDEQGVDITNEVTYLVLDIIEELGISDFPTTVRLSKNTDEKLVRRTSEVIAYGGGVVAVYNEDLIIPTLTKYGYPLEDARNFANDGCWEVQIPGKTDFGYFPFDSLQILQKTTLGSYEPGVEFDSFEALFDKYKADLGKYVTELCTASGACHVKDSSYPCGWKFGDENSAVLIALFEPDCVDRGISYFEGGTVYSIRSPHIGGLADTADSLFAIKKLVFEEKKISFSGLMALLKNNWNGGEALRQYALNKLTYYGNDSDGADEIAAEILNTFADVCDSTEGLNGYRYPAGVSTFGRQLEWSEERLASPHGHFAGEVLAANISPTPGTDKEGCTAIIRSYCKMPLGRMVTGAALDIKLLPSSVSGEDGLCALVSLLHGFVTLGGYFMQPDVVDAAVLHRAQEHPEDYQTLSVRVSGWNARFITLNREWQNMVIAETERK